MLISMNSWIGGPLTENKLKHITLCRCGRCIGESCTIFARMEMAVGCKYHWYYTIFSAACRYMDEACSGEATVTDRLECHTIFGFIFAAPFQIACEIHAFVWCIAAFSKFEFKTLLIRIEGKARSFHLVLYLWMALLAHFLSLIFSIAHRVVLAWYVHVAHLSRCLANASLKSKP